MPALIALVCPSTTQLNRPRQDRGTQRFPKQLADHLQQLGVAQGLVQPDQQQWAPDAHHGRIIGIVCISDAKPVQHMAELSTREHRLMMHLHCRRGEGGTCQLLLAEPLATAMMVQPVPQPRSFGKSQRTVMDLQVARAFSGRCGCHVEWASWLPASPSRSGASLAGDVSHPKCCVEPLRMGVAAAALLPCVAQCLACACL